MKPYLHAGNPAQREEPLNDLEKKEADEDLAVAYVANDRMTLELLEEFKNVDCEW